MNQKILETIKVELSLGEVKYLHSTGSTNDDAHQWLMNDAPHLSVIVANEQTQGRGRADHHWYTPPDSGLALSIILVDEIHINHLLRYSGLGSLAVHDALLHRTSSPVEIKWPNDILIAGRKVGGVLPEIFWFGAKIKGIVLGIGVNISEDSLPEQKLLSYPATFLEDHTQQIIDPADICKSILTGVINWHKKIDTPDFIRAWENSLAYIKKEVQIVLSNQETKEGYLVGLANDGKILISFADGSVGEFNSNEISLLPQFQ